ncbi:hypothetical protein MFU01_46570 [Myxococcus fulvus]|uniref:Uncharacterized protein n=1 Tax=Myxococcus fulvus TaxID=33 RepID=A0A511T624_MYXFU|nr:hypothetical protein [Myxococcus fulvus]GEN09620.1 hypothetical protein MFU01_46570 [Myxococcus fulvus]
MSNKPPPPDQEFIITATRKGWRLNGAGCEESITIAMDARQRVRFEIEPEPKPAPSTRPDYILIGRARSRSRFRVPVVLNTFLPEALPAGKYHLVYLFREGPLGGELSGTLNVGTGAEEDDGLLNQPPDRGHHERATIRASTKPLELAGVEEGPRDCKSWASLSQRRNA